MALLNSLLLNNYGGGLLGSEFGQGYGMNGLRPEDEAAMAQAAREAAAARMGRSARRGGFDPSIFNEFPTQALEQQLMPQPPMWPMQQQPQAPVQPQSFAPSLPAPVNIGARPIAEPPMDNAQLPPNATPTMGAGSPMQPQAPGPIAQAPSMWSQIGSGIADNSALLMGLGAGIAQGGIGKGLQYATQFSALDRAEAQSKLKTAGQLATYKAVLKATGDQNKALLAASNPEAAKFMLDRIYGEKKPSGTFKVGNVEIPYIIGEDGQTRLLTPGGSGSVGDLISHLQQLDAQGKKQEAAATAAGKAQGEAAAALPNTLAKADQAIALIDEIKQHPGKPYAVGIAGPLPGIPGTSQQDFITRIDQLKGQTFLEAYQTLKGGGQITEVEGKKAEAAIARLNRSQSPKEFDRALDDLREVIKSGRERAGVIAGGQPTPANDKPAAVRRFNPATGRIE